MLCAQVIGPAHAPAITDASIARASPDLAVLSTLAHARGPLALAIGRALFVACGDLDAARARLYADVVFGFLDESTRAALEAEMQIDEYEYQDEIGQRLFAHGRAKGLAQGMVQGRVEGLVRAVLGILAARGVEVDAASRERIVACRDEGQLEEWVTRAVACDGVGGLFG